MRISDWSSDVCSSDLPVAASERSPNSPPPDQAPAIPAAAPRKPPAPDSQRTAHPPHPPSAKPPPPAPRRCAPKAVQSPAAPAHPPSTAQSRPPAFQIHRQPHARQPGCQPLRNRSEEHTSELQSLMRISYAVFCLKKKKKHISSINITQNTHQIYKTTDTSN